MTIPAPTPAEKALKRVLLISAIDSWFVIGFAGLGTLVTLMLGDFSGVGVGLLVLAAGLMELRGRRRLKRRDPEGMKLLVRAQMFLVAVILVYCASRLGSYDQESMLASLTPEMRSMLKESGVEVADIVPMVQLTFFAAYGLFALLTLILQGGLALYYRRKTALVTEALKIPPIPINYSVL